MKTCIESANAPAAIGPYSQAIKAGGLIFVSGQLPMDPVSGQLISGSMGQLTARCLDNAGAILKAAGVSMDDVVKTTIFLTDLAHFAEVNEAYAKYFATPAPARSCVAVAALPKGSPIEIELIAAAKN